MRPVCHLEKLQEAVERQLVRIERCVTPLSLPMTHDNDRMASYATLHLDNVWSSFVRSYYLSWFLRAKTTSGVRISTAITQPKSHTDAVKTAMRFINGAGRPRVGRQEPPWHERRVLVTLSTKCVASHNAQVMAAMSVPSTALEYLHSVRNFYAHRSKETADRLPAISRKLSLLPSRRATEIVLGVPLGGSGSVILDWIAEVRDVTLMLCS